MAASNARVGILALQGCIEPHLRAFSRLGVEAQKIFGPKDLERIDRIVLPGGESTTMLKLLDRSGLWQPLIEFGKKNPVWGICAGAILVAKNVIEPKQSSLGLMDIRAQRNYYGSQVDSFKANVQAPTLGFGAEVDFIRAPRLIPLSDAVTVLAKHGGDAVLLEQGQILVSSFHVELGDNLDLHRYFLRLI